MHIRCCKLMLRLVSYRVQASVSGDSNHSASAGGKEGVISLQQRMQQALAADIAPPPPPKHAPSPHLKQGSGSGSGLGSDGASMQEEDTGFWDLVYILYPEFAEAAGVGPLRELVPHWSLLERTLMVRVCYPMTKSTLPVATHQSAVHRGRSWPWVL